MPNTTVTAQLIDFFSLIWSNARVQVTFQENPEQPTGPYCFDGDCTSDWQSVRNFTTDSSGKFSISLPANTSISPAGSMWRFAISPNSDAPSVILSLPINGFAQDISSQFSNAASAYTTSSLPVPRSYDALTVSEPPNAGQLFFNTTALVFFFWDGTGWQIIESGGADFIESHPTTDQSITQPINTNFTISLSGTGSMITEGTFSIPAGAVTNPETIIQPEQNNLNFEGPGWNLGNSGGWSVNLGRSDVMQVSVRGISQAISPTINKHAIGDTAGVYVHLTSDGGIAAQSDEGVTGMTLSVLEPDTYFHGTVSSTIGIGDQAPVLAFASGSQWTTDGAFLLNISKGTISGNMIAASTPISFLDSAGTTVTSFLNSLDVGIGGVPLSTKIGVVGNIANPNVTANAPVLVTLSVKLLQIAGTTHAFSANDVVSVAGDFYPEQSIIQSVTTPAGSPLTQTITLKLRNPNTSAFIFCGGIQGQYISFDANLVLSGMRSSYYAFGSLTGQDMIYGNNVQGGLAGNMLPRIGYEAATSAAFDPNNGFHLYPGAEIVCNNTQGFDCTLEQNGVNWAVSDIVENPHFPTGGGNTLLITKIQDTPTDPSFQGVGIELALQGAGITGAFSPVRITNENPDNFYQQDGGPLIAPSFIRLFGSSDSVVIVNKAPKSAMISLESFHGTDLVTLIAVPFTDANFQFDPVLGVFIISQLQIGNGITVGNLNVGGQIQAGGQNGIAATITTAAITPTGTQGSMSFNRGILVAENPAT